MMWGMIRLPNAKRAQVLAMPCESSPMQSIARVVDVSFNWVVKLLADAGGACAAFHDQLVQGVKAKRVQFDEIWAFAHCKQRNVATAKAAPEEAGDIWTWTALGPDSKPIVCYRVGAGMPPTRPSSCRAWPIGWRAGAR